MDHPFSNLIFLNKNIWADFFKNETQGRWQSVPHNALYGSFYVWTNKNRNASTIHSGGFNEHWNCSPLVKVLLILTVTDIVGMSSRCRVGNEEQVCGRAATGKRLFIRFYIFYSENLSTYVNDPGHEGVLRWPRMWSAVYGFCQFTAHNQTRRSFLTNLAGQGHAPAIKTVFFWILPEQTSSLELKLLDWFKR